jgi:hypothetical protein
VAADAASNAAPTMCLTNRIRFMIRSFWRLGKKGNCRYSNPSSDIRQYRLQRRSNLLRACSRFPMGHVCVQ